MNISLTKGIFLVLIFLVKIEAASIGKDAFFEPEIFIVPLILFFLLSIIFAFKDLDFLGE